MSERSERAAGPPAAGSVDTARAAAPDDLVEAFRRAAGSRRLVRGDRLYRADLDTPLAIFARLKQGYDHVFLLESAEGGEKWARYSFLGLGRLVELVGYADRVEVHRNGQVERRAPGLDALRALIEGLAPELPELPERFGGGFVGYITYDAVREFERIPDRHPDPDAPLYRFVLPSVLGIFDNFRHDLRLVAFADARPLGAGQATEAARALETRLDELEERLQQAGASSLAICPRYETPSSGVDEATTSASPVELSSNVARSDFEEAVRRGKEYILAGDVFQVVLSQRLRARGVSLEPLDIYRRLRRANPSPYMFFIDYPDESLIGASPEVMVRLTGRRAELRPIAGTRPRGSTPDEDAALERELLADPKELAEHVMLLDLGRNDLGRVSTIGSIAIPERMVIERYSRVMHIVSHVEGHLRDGLDWLDLLGATFPAGTLTGAPKIRAMQIIDELEPTRRYHYGGAIGYIGFDGNMDLCIAIRTLRALKAKTTPAGSVANQYIVQAGAGIVADSVPANEYEETLNKARALLGAVGIERVSDEIPVEETSIES